MENRRNTNRKFKGFTLIELSVVLPVLGVLAAILVPAMMGWVEKSNNATDAENARIICNAIFPDAITLVKRFLKFVFFVQIEKEKIIQLLH